MPSRARFPFWRESLVIHLFRLVLVRQDARGGSGPST